MHAEKEQIHPSLREGLVCSGMRAWQLISAELPEETVLQANLRIVRLLSQRVEFGVGQ